MHGCPSQSHKHQPRLTQLCQGPESTIRKHSRLLTSCSRCCERWKRVCRGRWCAPTRCALGNCSSGSDSGHGASERAIFRGEIKGRVETSGQIYAKFTVFVTSHALENYRLIKDFPWPIPVLTVELRFVPLVISPSFTATRLLRHLE